MLKNKNNEFPEERSAQGEEDAIDDGEMLARFVLLDDGKIVGSNKRIRVAALKTHNFRKENGWSLSRKGYICDMSGELEKRSIKKDGRPYGYALVNAGGVRKIQDEGQRQAIRVIADPKTGNPAHALAQKTREYSKSEAQSIRDILLQKFSEVKVR